MTKEEIFKKHEKGRVLTYDKVPEFILNAMEEYALHIVEQAVEEELNVPYWNNDTKKYQKATCNRILSRIKILTWQE